MNTSYLIIGVIAGVMALIVVLWILKKTKGSIEIVPEKYSYSSGETIKGNLSLKLKKPVESTKLVVGLKCERVEKTYSADSKSSQSKKVPLFDFNQPLEGKKNYSPSEYNYDFSIKIPQNVSQKLEGVAGTLVKSAQILMGKNSSTKWYLYAELKCKGINLSKKIQINII